MKPRSCGSRRAAVAVAGALLFSSGALAAQSVVERTPNLSGGWAGTGGTAYFTFLHRFDLIDVPEGEDRLANSPTLLAAYSLTDLFLLGAQYTSSSMTVPGHPNEWEALVRFAPFPPGAGLPFELALTGAWNEAAGSVDGELAVGVPAGPATFMSSMRAFSSAFGEEDGRTAFGAGLRLRVRPGIALAGDWVLPTDRREGEAAGWGAALQLAILDTPHSLSLQATNTSTATLQGSSRAEGRVVDGRYEPRGTRWGFEFTVPLALSRYLGGGSAARDRTVTADTVRVAIRDLEFEVTRLVVQPGTTVIWVNEGNLPHTSTSDGDLWDSSLLAPGESYGRVFLTPGEHAYHCVPHPSMRATVVVQP